ncbi:Cof-type HAD-IIB family hydrolase [Mycoplasma sp. Mirounga ES2805-ORL]|uniref:Cof-type HAD-IIB family hydrolase n=1 Tax=Mycoplasma sp. Mirounga ES2805-ORL TaxID=754514 RepID=UPI00197C6B2C|nr:Cof-type HAD-IIB family hydrolase [Mycoplasma sp. Mirounga ES2805-ORL]QSF13757.1 Cof-type HAD-IIB family hydrolase [Mycoplasma sp. Mirounga ES2805-ORL]
MKINNIEGYFIDIDGTLLDDPETGTISKGNIEYLKELQKLKPVIPSTGRSPKGFVPELMKAINAPYAVCSTGAIIIDNNENIIIKKIIDHKLAEEILKYFMLRELYIIINGSGSIYFKDRFNWHERAWEKLFSKEKYSKINIENQDVNQLLVFGLSIEKTKELKEIIEEKWPSLSCQIVSHGYSLEITSAEATKGKGNKHVAELLGINIKNCVHIGDSDNDASALPETGFLIAMANSQLNLKDKAHYIGYDYMDSGLAKTIREFEDNTINLPIKKPNK